MGSFLEALGEAFRLLFSRDPDFWSAVWVSFSVSVISVVAAAAVCVPLAFGLTLGRFPGRRFLLGLFETLTAVPTVVVGLFAYVLLTRKGLLGPLDLLFTPTAMAFAETLLIVPLVVSLSASALDQLDKRFSDESWTLGLHGLRKMGLLLGEARGALSVAIFTGLGRAISEVGCAMMVGGNIRGATRNITTTIALETSKGEFSLGLALGLVLLVMALLLNLIVRALSRGRGGR